MMKGVEAHIRGQVTIGAYALDRKSQARWICYDADEVGEWEKLCGLAYDLTEERIPSYLEKSRRGGHLWLFTNPLPGRDARRFARQLIVGRDLNTVEIYPRQDELRTGPGSFVRLPLGVHQKTGKLAEGTCADDRDQLRIWQIGSSECAARPSLEMCLTRNHHPARPFHPGQADRR
jgi:hypothetical protein